MRVHAYNVFEIVAWPAAVWCSLELFLRAASTNFAGATWTLLTGLCAALTIVACRMRTRQLATAARH